MSGSATPISAELVQMANRLGIRFPCPLPLFSNPPNREHLNAWVESQSTPMLRQIAKKIVDNINHIFFETFLNQLKQTVADFNQKIGDEPYVLWISRDKDILKEGCSDQWVAGLAMEYCGLTPPAAIVGMDELAGYLKSNPQVRKVLILDDAAYSGTQKTNLLASQLYYSADLSLEQVKSIHLYLGIAFQTPHATNLLSPNNFPFKNLVNLAHTTIPSVLDCLSETERRYAQNLEIGFIGESKTLTYFDHRYPDFMSNNPLLKQASSLTCSFGCDFMRFLGYTSAKPASGVQPHPSLKVLSLKEWNKTFLEIMPNHYARIEGYTIPEIIPPYYLHRAEKREALKANLEKNLTGKRNQTAPNDPLIAEILANTQPQEQKQETQLITRSIVPLQKQIAFDQAVLAGNWKTAIYGQKQESQRDPAPKRNPDRPPQKLENALRRYIARIDSHKKQGQTNFEYGFIFFRKSRAINRAANYFLAKSLLEKLEKSSQNRHTLFSHIKQQRTELFRVHGLNRDVDRGINSSELNAILKMKI